MCALHGRGAVRSLVKATGFFIAVMSALGAPEAARAAQWIGHLSTGTRAPSVVRANPVTPS